MSELIETLKYLVNKPDLNENQLLQELIAITGNIQRKDHLSVEAKQLGKFISNLNYDNKPIIGKIATGYEELDQKFGCFNMGELIVLGARPSMGKTQLLANLALYISQQYSVLYVTTDLSETQMGMRFLATLSGIRTDEIQNQISDSLFKKNIENISDDLKNRKLFISGLSDIDDIITLCNKQVNANNTKVIFIDYLQLINNAFTMKNNQLKLAVILARLKQFAVEFDVCIVVASQLSRKTEERSYASVPQLRDLSDKGISEKIANKILLLYRPEYYGYEIDEEDNETKGMVDLLIVKNQLGPTGKIRLKRNEKFTSIDNI